MSHRKTISSLCHVGLVGVVFVVASAWLSGAGHHDPQPAGAHPKADQALDTSRIGLDSAPVCGVWTEQVTERIRRAEYQPSLTGLNRWSAPNRAHDLRTQFEPYGLQVTPRTGDAGWRLDMRLRAFGREGAMRTVAPVAPAVTEHRVEYRRSDLDLVEWYVNDHLGIEQGFTIARQPRGGRTRPVVLELAVEDELTPRPASGTAATTEVLWHAPDGRPVLRYGKLLVTDATGRTLPAQLEVAGQTLRIVVDDTAARYPVTVDPLLTAYSWSAEGQRLNDQFGLTVATAGDVNGDGYSDVLVGAPEYDGGNNTEGKVYLYLGSSGGPAIDASWTAESNNSLAEFGSSIATAGDVNGDGYHDVIIGAPIYSSGGGLLEEGRAFVWLGGPDDLGDDGTPANADWVASGDVAGARLGTSVSSAGDVNGDGYDDILVGAPYYESGPGEHEEGWVLVWHGGASGLGNAGTPANADWHAESNYLATFFGEAVSTAGDVNGDGYDDVVMGWSNYILLTDPITLGRALAWYGSSTGLGATGTPANADWSYVNGGTRYIGQSVSGAGDVNGDGYADVIVGAPEVDAATQGQVYLFYGGPAGLNAAAGATRTGAAGEQFGGSVDTAGDVNGDGFADVVIGAPLASLPDAAEGRALVYHGGATGLSGTPSWTGQGDQGAAHFGIAVACAGDVNGDGFGDLIVGADLYDGVGVDRGAAFVYLGAPAGPQSFAAWSPDGDQTFAGFGVCVASAGDVNGDGYGDVVVGAPQFDPGTGRRGRVYVFHGSAAGLPAAEDWFEDSPDAGAYFGHTVACAGDVNGDGYDDVIVGAHHFDGALDDVGAAFLFNGSIGGLGHVVAWSVEGGQTGARFGVSVDGAGDVNGDGYADLVIGAEEHTAGQTNEGRVHVYYGSASGPQAQAWIEEGNHQDGLFGCSVASAGDVNGDGFSDVVIGESGYDGGENGEGRAYVYLGAASGLPASPAWTEERNQLFAHFGASVASAGDVNGDGYSDVIVGAPFFDGSHQDEGRAYVFFGSPTGPSSIANWSADFDQAGVYAGTSVASAGDVNGDGFSDVLVGGPGYDGGNLNEGRAWLYLGSPTVPAAASAWGAESNQDQAEYGHCVAPAGDVNGDGFADLVVGAHRYDLGEQDEGRVYLYYGNGGDGLDRAPQQRRTPNNGSIALLGKSDSETGVRLRARCRSAAGRRDVGLQWEIERLGTGFDGTGLGTMNLADSGAPGASGSVVVRSIIVSGLSPATVYHWRSRVVSTSPKFPRTPWLTLAYNGASEADLRTGGVATAAPAAAATVAFALQGAYPNPAPGWTQFHYALPRAGRADLAIYDLRGRRVATLQSEPHAAGVHAASWDGRDGQGAAVAAGTYIARLTFDGMTRTSKLTLVR